jgi:ribosomal-protein-alanine N-acetyltransferase
LIELGTHKDGEEYEISYQFHPNYWGNGFAYEAAAAVIQHAFNQLELDQVIAETQSANQASCALLQRLGMTEMKRISRFGAQQIIFALRKHPKGLGASLE